MNKPKKEKKKIMFNKKGQHSTHKKNNKEREEK